MKSIRTKLLLFFIVLGAASACFNDARAQEIRAALNFSDYDIIFLTDFIESKTQKFNANASGISLVLDVIPYQTIRNVYVYVDIQAQLRGDPRPDWLVRGNTNTFTIEGSRTLTARDFAKGGSDISRGTLVENTSFKKRITNLAQGTSTVPPGTYQILMTVFNPTNKEIPYTKTSKTIVIPYSGIENAFVEINDPRNGSFTNNLAPTFSWTTSAPRITVRVYEAGMSNRSPQDALTSGNPYLVKELSGVTTLTYPQDAKRQLQENKAYVLQVEANVTTNRGESGNFSRPVVFRITDDKIGTMVENFLNISGSDASSTFSALRAEPSSWVAWRAYGNITLDGSTIMETDLQTLLNDLASRPELKLQLSVENQ